MILVSLCRSDFDDVFDVNQVFNQLFSLVLTALSDQFRNSVDDCHEMLGFKSWALVLWFKTVSVAFSSPEKSGLLF